MASISPALRHARSEVIPFVPELAPWLDREPDIIQDHLLLSIERFGVDSTAIPAVDINKLTRHTIAGFLIGQQRELLVAGAGREANFVTAPVATATPFVGLNQSRFAAAARQTFDYGARRVERKYTANADREHSWYPLAAHRYWQLGRIATNITPRLKKEQFDRFFPHHNPIPREGQSLHVALRTAALSSVLTYYLGFIRRHVKGHEERVQAAHDLAQIPFGIASGHFYEMTQKCPPAWSIRAKVERGQNSVYTVEWRNRKNLRKMFPRLKNLPNTTLKCPAHATTLQTGSGHDADTGDPASYDTNLTYFVHAGINLAAERYNLL